MNVLFVSSEAAPYIKVGGLGDVCGALPKALAPYANVSVIIPKYRGISEKHKQQMEHIFDFNVSLSWRNQYCGVEHIKDGNTDFYFIDNEYYFHSCNVYGQAGSEECERFSFFCKAVLETVCRLDTHFDIIHAHDWQCAMIPFLIRTQYAHSPSLLGTRSVFTIHNLSYQGNFNRYEVCDLLSIPNSFVTPDKLEFFGDISFMKAGILYADAVTTVSRTYAQEIKTAYYGERLDGVLQSLPAPYPIGIMNGIDTVAFNPKTDWQLAANYDINSIENKRLCKEALQSDMWLDRRDVLLIAMVTRFTTQKGLDLVMRIFDDMLKCDVQFAILGSGEARYEDYFCGKAREYGGRVSIKMHQDDNMARRMYAGADVFLMPSLFEPCGIAQMLAMRYGTVPIVRETGGLFDSVQPYNCYTGAGNGITFANYNAHELLYCIERAVTLYCNKEIWNGLVRHAMECDFSWAASAREYADLYRRLCEALDT